MDFKKYLEDLDLIYNTKATIEFNSSKAFDEFKMISPASGKVWNTNKAINKFYERSLYESPIHFKTKMIAQSGWGDADVLLDYFVESRSLWSDSPPVILTGVLPLHFTCNGDFYFNFGTNPNPYNPHFLSQKLNVIQYCKDGKSINHIIPLKWGDWREKITDILSARITQALKNQYVFLFCGWGRDEY